MVKVHNGIRPQDLIVLLKLFLDSGKQEKLSVMAQHLGLSTSEISKSMERSRYAGLLLYEDKVATRSLLEFFVYGLPYAFPVQPGSATRGIPTAVSHPEIARYFSIGESFVWPVANGVERGFAIVPLYPSLPAVIPLNPGLYFATALLDVLRIGKTREKQFAQVELQKLLHLEPAYN